MHRSDYHGIVGSVQRRGFALLNALERAGLNRSSSAIDRVIDRGLRCQGVWVSEKFHAGILGVHGLSAYIAF